MKKKLDKDIPRGLTPAGRRANEEFTKAYKENVKKPMERISLSILVWGPNPSSDTPVARKRVQIKETLLSCGYNAMFSEDILNTVIGYQPDLKSAEIAQARSVHLIIVLIEDSPGALGEVHDFCNHPEIAHKFYVMAPNSYKDNYAAKGALKLLHDGYGGVHWYDESELEACNVLSEAMKRANARRACYAIYSI